MSFSFGSTLAWVPLPKRNPKNRPLDPPVCIIIFYNIQPKNANRNIHIPRLHLPTAHLRNRPEISRPRPKANSPVRCRNTAHFIITRPRTSPLALPFSGSAGSRRVQIHPTISCSVRAGSTRQTVPRNRPPRCGFTQQSKRDRSATWWPGDIHNRPSVQAGIALSISSFSIPVSFVDGSK